MNNEATSKEVKDYIETLAKELGIKISNTTKFFLGNKRPEIDFKEGFGVVSDIKGLLVGNSVLKAGYRIDYRSGNDVKTKFIVGAFDEKP